MWNCFGGVRGFVKNSSKVAVLSKFREIQKPQKSNFL